MRTFLTLNPFFYLWEICLHIAAPWHLHLHLHLHLVVIKFWWSDMNKLIYDLVWLCCSSLWMLKLCCNFLCWLTISFTFDIRVSCLCSYFLVEFEYLVLFFRFKILCWWWCVQVHARCYGEREPMDGVLWLCNLCRPGAPVVPPPCCLCPVIGTSFCLHLSLHLPCLFPACVSYFKCSFF